MDNRHITLCISYNTAMANPFRQAIIDLIEQNHYKFTYQEVAEKFNISAEQVRGVARSNQQIFNLFRKEGGII